MAQAYEQASNLLQILFVSSFDYFPVWTSPYHGYSRVLIYEPVHSAELEITVNLLIQVDKLVQLLESPVFTCTFPSTDLTPTTSPLTKPPFSEYYRSPPPTP